MLGRVTDLTNRHVCGALFDRVSTQNVLYLLTQLAKENRVLIGSHS